MKIETSNLKPMTTLDHIVYYTKQKLRFWDKGVKLDIIFTDDKKKLKAKDTEGILILTDHKLLLEACTELNMTLEQFITCALRDGIRKMDKMSDKERKSYLK
jgi:hypothetical protein